MRKSVYGSPFCAALLVLFFYAVALAQDPTKVEPTHYKLAFENEYVQVVDVHYGPHERSNLHAHPGGVVVVLTAGISASRMKMARHKRCSPSRARPAGTRPSSTKWKTSGILPTAPSISGSNPSV